MKQKYLQTGDVFVTREPMQIITVLGSCIAVCLYDTREQIGGMNHYLLPLWNGHGLQSPRYGNIAIERLIDTMQANGCRRENMVAKLFGGAQMHKESIKSLMIGDQNYLIAKELLHANEIRIIAEDTLGTKGRKIMFDTQSGKVLMKYLQGRTDD